MHLSLLRSPEDVIRLSVPLRALAQSSSLSSDLTQFPEYFLGRLEGQMRPCVVAGWDGNTVIGVLYASERKIARIPTGWCFGGDEMGRGLIAAKAGEEDSFLAEACTFLLNHGIHAFRFRRRRNSSTDISLPALADMEVQRTSRLECRPEGDWLHLEDDFDRFLERLGPHTRRNLRYYRRKAEAAGFHFESDITRAAYDDAVSHLRELTDFVHPAGRHMRDQQFIRVIGNPVLVGLRTTNGPYVSVLSAVRFHNCMHVLSQLNDGTLRQMSISVVLRSYLIEWAIQQGIRSMHFINGTTPMLGRYCEPVYVQHIAMDQYRSLAHPLKLSGVRWARNLQRDGRWVPMRLRTMLGSYLPD